ncbi:hypothetical protein DPMN_175881 [Dreissena polymorpha]|uniref:Uncharacterized protein n=1 Tax=Dreissena polymorpha TaxID=45954 RepID=A0A9D4IIN4_DREPO|nr:hypothetical protein DPMN_175881 [Dreissena polymorpha]
MASKRFSTISEEVLKALDREKDAKNTKRVVKHGMNLYDEYLRSNYMDLVENPEELNNQIDDTPDDTTGEGKIYEQPGSTFCPVRCFEKYLSKLNPKLEALWQNH